RQRLAELAIDAEALKYTGWRSPPRQLRGEPPGPEGSVLKLSGSELGVRIADAAGELLGMHVLVNQASPTVPDASRWFNRVLAARQYTISAGTSEIQRNIIGAPVPGPPSRSRLRPAASRGSSSARDRTPPADRGWRRVPPRR